VFAFGPNHLDIVAYSADGGEDVHGIGVRCPLAAPDADDHGVQAAVSYTHTAGAGTRLLPAVDARRSCAVARCSGLLAVLGMPAARDADEPLVVILG
jgi:hypothetical protein